MRIGRVPCDPCRVTSTRPPLERQRDGALVGGVASGLARHLGVQPVAVRLVFAVLSVFGGSGLLAYAAFWVFIPQTTSDDSRPTGGRERLQVPAVAAIALGGALLLHSLRVLPGASVLWPMLVVGVGVAIVWQQADDAQRRRWLGASSSGGGSTLRVIGGVALLVSGVAVFLATNGELAGTMNGVLAAVVIAAGIVLTFAPWWWRLLNDFTDERRARIRFEQ